MSTNYVFSGNRCLRYIQMNNNLLIKKHQTITNEINNNVQLLQSPVYDPMSLLFYDVGRGSFKGQLDRKRLVHCER